MIASENGKPTGNLRLSVDEWPITRPAYTYVLPRLALAFAFKQKVPELTISYEDAAEVILDNLSENGRFSRRRVAVALPPGLRNYKIRMMCHAMGDHGLVPISWLLFQKAGAADQDRRAFVEDCSERPESCGGDYDYIHYFIEIDGRVGSGLSATRASFLSVSAGRTTSVTLKLLRWHLTPV
jgi:hypothetical protein